MSCVPLAGVISLRRQHLLCFVTLNKDRPGHAHCAECEFRTAESKFQAAQAVEDAKFQQQANYCRVWTI